MKRGTPEHPKVYFLAAALDVPKYAAVGVLECLWHFAQEYARDGGVGRYPDDAIARWIGWPGEAVSLIHGLAVAGWLDRCQCHRLRVHDWPIHADQTVKRVLAEHGQGFLSCYDDASTVLAPSQLPCRTKPNQAEPVEPAEDAVRDVHSHWLTIMGRRATTKLLPERREKIRARLREGFSVEQLRQAIEGCKASPFHQGQNDRKTVYDDLMLICRSGSKVEYFIGLYEKHKATPEEPGIKHGLPTKGPWEKAG